MKNFSIFKNDYKKEGEKTPDYKIMVSGKEGEKMVEAGGCWLKDGKNSKYFSCKLNDEYVDNAKGFHRKGFTIIEDKKESLPEKIVNTIEENPHNIPF